MTGQYVYTSPATGARYGVDTVAGCASTQAARIVVRELIDAGQGALLRVDDSFTVAWSTLATHPSIVPPGAARVARLARAVTSDEAAMRGMLATVRDAVQGVAHEAAWAHVHGPRTTAADLAGIGADGVDEVASIIAGALLDELMGEHRPDGECVECGRSTNHPSLTRCSRHEVDA